MTTTFDDVRVTAITQYGEHETTMVKAIQNNLRKQARRDEQHLATMQRLGKMTKQAKAYWRQVHLEKFGEQINKAVKNRRAQLEKAEANESIAKSRASIERSKEKQRQATIKVNDAKTEIARQHSEIAAKLAEVQKGVDTVTANYERATAVVAKAQVRNAARVIQRHNDELAEWQAKAAATSDPLLKAGYLERVEAITEGKAFDDE